MREVRIGGRGTEKQQQFFHRRERYIAYGGARGGGKSWALRRKLCLLCLNYPGIRCLLIRRTLEELRSNHLYPFLSEYGDLFDYRELEKTFTCVNGSTVTMGYCDGYRDTLRYQGQEYDIIALDEATQLSEYQFQIFKGCLRGVNNFPHRMYLTCNPGGEGHAFVKRLFIDRQYREGEHGEDYAFVPAGIRDNPYLTKADPDYIRGLQSLPEKMRRAWLDGDWNAFEGQFFSEFSEEKHCFPKGYVPECCKKYVALDYGLDCLAVLLFGVDEEGNLFVLKEFSKSNLTLSQAGEAVASFCYGEDVGYCVCSPDLWNRRQDTGKSGAEIMQNVSGMPPMTPADDRRIPGWRMVRDYLNGGQKTLKISPHCQELIRCMKGLCYSKVKAEDAADSPHELTHLPEALRYGVMQRETADTPPVSHGPHPFDWGI